MRGHNALKELNVSQLLVRNLQVASQLAQLKKVEFFRLINQLMAGLGWHQGWQDTGTEKNPSLLLSFVCPCGLGHLFSTS